MISYKRKQFLYKEWILKNLDTIVLFCDDIEFLSDYMIVNFKTNVFYRLINDSEYLKFDFYNNPFTNEHRIFIIPDLKVKA